MNGLWPAHILKLTVTSGNSVTL